MKVSDTSERCLVLYWWTLFPCEFHIFSSWSPMSEGVCRRHPVATEVLLSYSELMFVCCCQSALRSGTNQVLFLEPVFPVPVTLPSGIGDGWHAGALLTIRITSACAPSHPCSKRQTKTDTEERQINTLTIDCSGLRADTPPGSPSQCSSLVCGVAFSPFSLSPAFSSSADCKTSRKRHSIMFTSWCRFLTFSYLAHKFHLQESPEGVSWWLSRRSRHSSPFTWALRW